MIPTLLFPQGSRVPQGSRAFRYLTIVLVSLLLGACAHSEHMLIRKADFAVAEQCLIAQQQYQPIVTAQQEQIRDSLKLLRESFELHKEHVTLRDYLGISKERLAEIQCPQVDSPYQQTATERQLDKQIVGEIENVLLTNMNIIKRARIDTGATTSSLDARDVQIFERNGEEWVRFTIINQETQEPMELERKRVRKVRIVQANTEEPERRPVIELRITLGRITQVAEFTLSDRSHLEFPVLIGRNVLRDVMLVDVSKINFAPLVPPESPSVNNGGRNGQ